MKFFLDKSQIQIRNGLALSLTGIGIRPVRKTSVGDLQEDIIAALTEASQRVNVIIVTGGLGPTKDDITKHTFCKYFNTELKINEDALALVTEFFAKRGREMTELNIQQAALPENCTYIPNLWGTAPGMWFEKDGVIYVSLPGCSLRNEKPDDTRDSAKVERAIHF